MHIRNDADVTLYYMQVADYLISSGRCASIRYRSGNVRTRLYAYSGGSLARGSKARICHVSNKWKQLRPSCKEKMFSSVCQLVTANC